MENVKKSLLTIFPTVISNNFLEGMDEGNQQICRYIFELENKKKNSVTRSHIGGFHSSGNILFQNIPALISLRKKVFEKLAAIDAHFYNKKYSYARTTIESWANVNRFGAYNSIHSHPNSRWSGVYYVTSNPEASLEHPLSGRFEFIDPRPAQSVAYFGENAVDKKYLINPVAGQLLIFPSWLQHQVHPNFDNQPRISIAFNVAGLK